MTTKKIIISIIGIFILVGIPSCTENKDYWIPSYIDVYGKGINQKDKNGYFVFANMPIDLNYDVYDFDNYPMRYVNQVQFYYGEIVIQSSIAYPSVSVAVFDGNGNELSYINLPWGGRGENVYDGKDVQNFLYNISTYLNYGGFVGIEVYVNDVQLVGNQKIEANVYMEVKSLIY